MNVLDFCTPVEDDPNVSYEVNSSDMYPAMVAMLQDLASAENTERVKAALSAIRELEAKRMGYEQERILSMTPADMERGMSDEVTPNPITRIYLPRVRRVPQGAWEMALQPMSEDLSPENKEARAEALELARLVFTEMLQQTLDGQPLAIRLTKDDTYRIRE